MKELAKTYDPKQVEDRCYQYWLQHDLFHAEENAEHTPYTIMIPPPNVTGILHMGHALQGAIQDAIIRFRRMQGYEALWMPGTDHAGIATQNVVEKKLQEKGIHRTDIGREKFLEEVWKWKDEHGSVIRKQLEKLGSSCDWNRERFTMDAGLSKAVREVFILLYKKGLLYRGKYIVNWCPRCGTAISDEEVTYKEVQGKLWYLRYPVTDSNAHVVVATTRPETMLGDTAVAFNPTDERYIHLKGKTATLPLIGRALQFIDDPIVDKDFGTGAVKVTPAHDPNDFEMGQRHNLEQVVVIDQKACITDKAPAYQGLDRYEARAKVLDDLEAQDFIEKIEDYTHSVGHCQRCQTVIEPSLSTQWFVHMKPLAEKGIQAVRSGEIVFHPKRWEKTYFDWMENIRDWCISRQLWWGHRIPVWYCHDCNEVIVRHEAPVTCPKCQSNNLHQDEDVLDTWFSSWLWPFSTLGWPEKTPALRYFYPTSVLVSGYDIIFFWIARMIMAGLEFMNDIPYKDVYITGMIKDELGRWMSKSLGNGIDPLEMIEQYGADSVRYSLVALATEGQDIKLSKEKFELGRNFGNKIWNAFRFLYMNKQQLSAEPPESKPFTHELCDEWILSRLAHTEQRVIKRFDAYRINEALQTIFDFFWHDYCDYYLELVKDRFHKPEGGTVLNTIAIPVFEKLLMLLHPFMPFITEELWQLFGDWKRPSIMKMQFKTVAIGHSSPEAEKRMRVIQQVITMVRNIRGEMNLPPQQTIPIILSCPDTEIQSLFTDYGSYVEKLAKVDSITIKDTYQPGPATATGVSGTLEIFIPLEGVIDLDVERNRLQKEMKRLENQIQSIQKKLKNEKFLKNAPPKIIERERTKLQEYQTSAEKLFKHHELLFNH